MRFVDETTFVLAAGSGGDGKVSFRREKFVPRGGPDGGDGGRGGAVILEATTHRNTLVDFRRNKVYRAEAGKAGESKQCYGRSGKDLLLPVPVGTIVFDAESGEQLADLASPEARWVVPGGEGGKGNIHFKSSRMRTPRTATAGEEGRELKVRLELRLIADIGLLGFPNAGKSTLVSTLSAARPKVAEYPFTTLAPSLGVVRVGDGNSFVIADIPGLIEGAAEGHGLGHRFLRHVRRCAGYAHLVACDDPLGSVVERYEGIQRELQQYDPDVAMRPQIVVLSKSDLLGPDELQERQRALEAAAACPVVVISAATQTGLRPLLHRMWALVQTRRAEQAPSTESENC